MGSIRRRPRIAAASAPAPAAIEQDDGFKNLRQAFQARLESERVHLVTLSAALARAEENPTWIFEDLVYRAHRLQGGAAIFEESEVAVAAGKLESAAVNAAESRAENTDEDVWAALEALVRLMGNRDALRGLAQA
jgi:HPt (histidine-containing phosphotransfer) domain-containing protein